MDGRVVLCMLLAAFNSSPGPFTNMCALCVRASASLAIKLKTLGIPRCRAGRAAGEPLARWWRAGSQQSSELVSEKR